MGQAHSNDYECNESEEKPSDGIVSKSREKLDSRISNRTIQESKCSNNGGPLDDHVRKLSIVSNRNIQLLSMRPRTERDVYADSIKQRRRSSLINLILGAPSSGPRFCDDLCSINSGLSDCNFGIEYFPDTYQAAPSIVSLDDIERGTLNRPFSGHKRRSSSIGSIEADKNVSMNTSGRDDQEKATDQSKRQATPSAYAHQARKQFQSKSTITSTLASIDLTSSFEQHDMKSGQLLPSQFYRPSLVKARQITLESITQDLGKLDLKTRVNNGRVNQSGRVLRRSGSELSLYSSASGSNGSQHRHGSCVSSNSGNGPRQGADPMKETKFIIMMQVCLPFILAGFGNMSAGLILNKVAEWQSFHHVPIFFVLLPPFIGLKGNIEMTLASRLSTLSNLNLLESRSQMRRAYASNLVLILSQAIGLSIFAAILSILCELSINPGKIELGNSSIWEISIYVVLASVLATSVVLIMVSSVVMSLSISLARFVQVNPDNLSTLIAALYGDVSCVLMYGLIADWMYRLRLEGNIIWPLCIIVSTVSVWPILMYMANKFEETHQIALSSVPPMMTSIVVSMGSGAILSMVVDRFHLIALYQPVVNGFGANLIAVQASRVSTWLWCGALRKLSTVNETDIERKGKTVGSLVSFVEPKPPIEEKKMQDYNPIKLLMKLIRTILWSFFNPSPNSIAARLLLVMLIPAHTIYFFVIWLLAPANHVTVTWQFYSIYIALCLLQVFILLTICQPLMTLLMNRHLDPDIFGISLLMALADLTGTLCLAGAFKTLAAIGDINAAKIS